MPDTIMFPDTRISLLRNGVLTSAGVQILENGDEVDVMAVRTDGKLATGHVALHPDILPELIIQLVQIHVTRKPGETELVRSMVASAISSAGHELSDEFETLDGDLGPRF